MGIQTIAMNTVTRISFFICFIAFASLFDEALGARLECRAPTVKLPCKGTRSNFKCKSMSLNDRNWNQCEIECRHSMTKVPFTMAFNCPCGVTVLDRTAMCASHPGDMSVLFV